jgi:hypothetical protein
MLIDFHSLTPKAQKLLNGFWCREAESLHPVTNGLRPQSFTNSAKSLPIAKNDRGSRRSRVRLRTGIANRLSWTERVRSNPEHYPVCGDLRAYSGGSVGLAA